MLTTSFLAFNVASSPDAGARALAMNAWFAFLNLRLNPDDSNFNLPRLTAVASAPDWADQGLAAGKVAYRIEGADRLKVICMHGVGVDHIDRAAARRRIKREIRAARRPPTPGSM